MSLLFYAAKVPGLYADVGKRANDLLSKEFPTQNKVEFKGKYGSNTQEVNFAKNGDAFNGNIVFKHHYAPWGVTGSITTDTEKQYKGEVTFDQPIPGAKVSLSVDGRKFNALEFTGEYKRDYVGVNGSFDVFNAEGTEATLAGVVGYEGFNVGLQSKYSRGALSAVNGVASYSVPEYALTAWGEFKKNRVGFTYYQKLNASTTAGFEAAYDLNQAQPSSAAKLTVAGSHSLDLDTTVKGKLDTDGKLSLSVGQAVSKNVRLVLGTAFNINNPNKGHQYGFTLAYNY